jgi:hypothetical protein
VQLDRSHHDRDDLDPPRTSPLQNCAEQLLFCRKQIWTHQQDDPRCAQQGFGELDIPIGAWWDRVTMPETDMSALLEYAQMNPERTKKALIAFMRPQQDFYRIRSLHGWQSTQKLLCSGQVGKMLAIVDWTRAWSRSLVSKVKTINIPARSNPHIERAGAEHRRDRQVAWAWDGNPVVPIEVTHRPSGADCVDVSRATPPDIEEQLGGVAGHFGPGPTIPVQNQAQEAYSVQVLGSRTPDPENSGLWTRPIHGGPALSVEVQ